MAYLKFRISCGAIQKHIYNPIREISRNTSCITDPQLYIAIILRKVLWEMGKDVCTHIPTEDGEKFRI